MSDVLQHIVALSIVAGCLGYVGWQGVQTFRGKRSRVGSCCAKGCDPQRQGRNPPAAAKTPQIVYIPIDMLGRGRKR